jgi:hypothetical protein
MSKSLRILLVVSLGLFMALGLAACGDDEVGHNTLADGGDFDGVWHGTVNYAFGGDSGSDAMFMDLTGSGSTVTGYIYDPGEYAADADVVTGTVALGVLSFTITNPNCANFNLTGTATLNAALTNMAMSGSGAVCDDSGNALQGSFNATMTKQ